WGKSPERIHTVLGSCLSITIWNPRMKSGGMCHFLLPRGTEFSSDRQKNSRYCEDSVSVLMEGIKKERTPIQEYEVKLFGGASMFGDGVSRIGENNILCAEEKLTEHGFVIKARHVGGKFSRHIVFELETGDVWVRTNRGILIHENAIDNENSSEMRGLTLPSPASGNCAQSGV
ncbi:MAG: chemotaxis protein CheD, partial [Spirochaetota bacterium]